MCGAAMGVTSQRDLGHKALNFEDFLLVRRGFGLLLGRAVRSQSSGVQSSSKAIHALPQPQ